VLSLFCLLLHKLQVSIKDSSSKKDFTAELCVGKENDVCAGNPQLQAKLAEAEEAQRLVEAELAVHEKVFRYIVVVLLIETKA
jgi:hypothetical protein